MFHTSHRILVSVLLCALPLSAQLCPPFQDDGFAGQCCQQASPVIPDFPEVTITTLYSDFGIGSAACPVGTPCTIVLTLGAPVINTCNRRSVSVTGVDRTTGAVVLVGALIMEYSRTFTWHDPTNTVAETSQVWRFMINGDLAFTQPTTCVVPPCQGTFGVVHMVGSLDYECHLANVAGSEVAVWDTRIDLTHYDRDIHHTGCRPLANPLLGHVSTRYSLIGPTPVSFTPAQPTFPGFYQLEAVREIDLVANLCYHEAESVDAVVTLAPSPCPRHAQETISGNSICNGVAGNFSTVPQPSLPSGSEVNFIATHSALPRGRFPRGLHVFGHVSILQVDWQCNHHPSGETLLCHGVTTLMDNSVSSPDPTPFGIWKTNPYNHSYATMFDLVNHAVVNSDNVAVPNFGCPDFAEFLLQLTQ